MYSWCLKMVEKKKYFKVHSGINLLGNGGVDGAYSTIHIKNPAMTLGQN